MSGYATFRGSSPGPPHGVGMPSPGAWYAKGLRVRSAPAWDDVDVAFGDEREGLLSSPRFPHTQKGALKPQKYQAQRFSPAAGRSGGAGSFVGSFGAGLIAEAHPPPHYKASPHLIDVCTGEYTIHTHGVSTFLTALTVPYHTLISLRWSRLLLLSFVMFVLVNLLFACLYYVPCLAGYSSMGILEDDLLKHTDCNLLLAFQLSIDTLSTIGYGEVRPVGRWCRGVTFVEAWVSLLILPCMSAVIFQKALAARRLRHTLVFSQSAVVGTGGGEIEVALKDTQQHHHHHAHHDGRGTTTYSGSSGACATSSGVSRHASASIPGVCVTSPGRLDSVDMHEAALPTDPRPASATTASTVHHHHHHHHSGRGGGVRASTSSTGGAAGAGTQLLPPHQQPSATVVEDIKVLSFRVASLSDKPPAEVSANVYHMHDLSPDGIHPDLRVREIPFKASYAKGPPAKGWQRLPVPYLSIPATLQHVITRDSPLYNCTYESLKASRTEVVAVVRAVDPATQSTIAVKAAYNCSNVVFDSLFTTDMVMLHPVTGGYEVDLGKFDTVIPEIVLDEEPLGYEEAMAAAGAEGVPGIPKLPEMRN